MEDSRRRIVAGYAIFTLLFLSGVFVYTLVRIEKLSLDNKDRVEAVVENLRRDLVLKFADRGTFPDNELSVLFTRLLDGEPNLLVIALSARGHGILKAMGRSKDYFPPAQFNDPAGPVKFNKPLGTAELAPEETPLTLTYKDAALDARLDALYQSFSYDNTMTLLRELLFIMLGYFVLTLIMIVVVSVSNSREDRIVAAATSRRPPAPAVDLPEFPPRRAPSPPGPLQEAERRGAGEPAADSLERIPELRDEPPGLAAPPPIEGLEWSEEEREARKRERLSGRSGLVRREYFSERLGLEIERAVSFNEDLALLLVSVSAARSGVDPWGEEFTAALRKFFGDPELSFEHGPDAAAVVAPGVGLETAIKAAKLLYRSLLESGLRACIGITSRNGRLVTPPLFAEEAAQALAQARSGAQSPIIAFRADADKYDRFIKKS